MTKNINFLLSRHINVHIKHMIVIEFVTIAGFD